MTRALLYTLACLSTLIACNTQRTICPAYQSTFYFDKTKQREAFVLYNDNKSQPREVLASNSKTLNLPPRDSSWDKSHVFQGPSLPIERRVKKDKYLLLPRKTYKKALRALQTVPMKPVYPKIGEDSVDIKKALDSAARSITDTLTVAAIDTTQQAPSEEEGEYVISKEKEKFNLDQDGYMWYFRDVLVLPDVKLSMEEGKTEAESSKAHHKKKGGGLFSKLKGLFKKKPKQKVSADTTATEQISPDQQIEEEADSTSVQPSQQALPQKEQIAAPTKKKGGLFKKKGKKQAAEKQNKEAKKEESDGF